MDVRVEVVTPEKTWPLRRDVLRPRQRLAEIKVPGEDSPDAVPVAAVTADGTVVATGVLMPERFPLLPDRAETWRLRGMATNAEWRNHGIGRRVLDYLIGYVSGSGGGLMWCHARLSARRFYERAGFVTLGEPWVDPAIGPHVAMWREVSGPGDVPG